MKKKILSIILCANLVMNNSLVVFAQEAPISSTYLNNENVEALYYDENGEMNVIMRDEKMVSLKETDSVSQSEICESINPLMRSATPTYKSTLGPYDDSRELWAKNEVDNDAIESMWILCSAYYSDGGHIDDTIEESAPNCTYQIMTAIVRVPVTPFDSARVGSGYSIHQYRDSRYKPVDHNLRWNM